MKELLPRVGEVLTQVIVYSDALAFELRLQDLRDQGRTTAARSCRLRLCLDRTDGGTPGVDRGADRALGHVVTRTDLGIGGQRCESGGACRCLAARALRENQL